MTAERDSDGEVRDPAGRLLGTARMCSAWCSADSAAVLCAFPTGESDEAPSAVLRFPQSMERHVVDKRHSVICAALKMYLTLRIGVRRTKRRDAILQTSLCTRDDVDDVERQ